MRRVEAGKATAIWTVALLSTVPAVGGYSNASSSRARRAHSGDLATVGIVTQVLGAAYKSSSAGSSRARALRAGDGLLDQDRLWLEPGARVDLLEESGNRVLVLGPAALHFERDRPLGLLSGAALVETHGTQELFFEHPLLNGKVTGRAAIWASEKQVQVLGVSGRALAWNPHLASAPVVVQPGFFAQNQKDPKRLEPDAPAVASTTTRDGFLARFGDDVEIEDEAVEGARKLASQGPSDEQLEQSRGTRDLEHLIEKRSPETAGRLKSHLMGRGLGSVAGLKSASAMPDVDAYGRRIVRKRDAQGDTKLLLLSR